MDGMYWQNVKRQHMHPKARFTDLGGGTRDITQAELDHIVKNLVAQRRRPASTTPATHASFSTGTERAEWPFELVIVPLSIKLSLNEVGVLRLTRAVLDNVTDEYARWMSMILLSEALTHRGIYFYGSNRQPRVGNPPPTWKRKPMDSLRETQSFADCYVRFLPDLLRHFTIPSAIAYCRGMTSTNMVRVFRNLAKFQFDPIKDAALDLMCAKHNQLLAQPSHLRAVGLRSYAGFLRKLCQRFKHTIHVEEIRRRVGANQMRRIMLVARGIAPVLVMDEDFRMKVTIKLVSHYPGTRNLAERILVGVAKRENPPPPPPPAQPVLLNLDGVDSDD